MARDWTDDVFFVFYRASSLPLFFFFYYLHACMYGFFVFGQEFVQAFGKGFLETVDYAFCLYYGAYFEYSAEYHHVEDFGIAAFYGCIHRVDSLD